MRIHRLTQPLFATVFVLGGVRTWRNPAPAAQMSASFLQQLATVMPGNTGELLARAPEQTVRANAAIQAAAGTLLALDRCPRAASALLAASLAPTTIAGHPYWQATDPKQRANHRVHFLKNLSLIGALLTRSVPVTVACHTGDDPSPAPHTTT